MTDLEDMVEIELRRRARSWAAIRERAERGLEFAESQRALTEGFQDAEYWHGKIDAYTAILDLL